MLYGKFFSSKQKTHLPQNSNKKEKKKEQKNKHSTTNRSELPPPRNARAPGSRPAECRAHTGA
jgi:hypothetical protein